MKFLDKNTGVNLSDLALIVFQLYTKNSSNNNKKNELDFIKIKDFSMKPKGKKFKNILRPLKMETAQQASQDARRVLRGKFIVIDAHQRKERSQTNNPTFYVKDIQKE